MGPSRDPDVPHPGMVFYSGQWYTPEAVERKNEWKREHNSVGAPGWVSKRKSVLKGQRERVINQLEELNVLKS